MDELVRASGMAGLAAALVTFSTVFATPRQKLSQKCAASSIYIWYNESS
jgi:hypothetical protein